MLRGYKAASNQTSASGWNGFRTNGGFSSSHVSGTFVGGGGSGAYGGNAASDTNASRIEVFYAENNAAQDSTRNNLSLLGDLA